MSACLRSLRSCFETDAFIGSGQFVVNGSEVTEGHITGTSSASSIHQRDAGPDTVQQPPGVFLHGSSYAFPS